MDHISSIFKKNVIKVVILPICIILIKINSLLLWFIMFIATHIKLLIIIFHCKIIVWPHCLRNDTSFFLCHLHGYSLVIIWNDFILITFSNDNLDIHVILSSIMDAIGMKTYDEKMMSSFMLSHHHMLVKCITNIWL